MRFYAIGLKKWVELRQSENEPRKLKTVKYNTYVEQVYDRNQIVRDAFGWPKFLLVDKKRRHRISSITYADGKRVGIVKIRDYKRLIGKPPKAGECREICESVLHTLIQRDWKKGEYHHESNPDQVV